MPMIDMVLNLEWEARQDVRIGVISRLSWDQDRLMHRETANVMEALSNI
jgi:hypothetical protein